MAKIHDSGSNYQFYDKKITPDIKRSAFDLSRIRQTTLDLGTLSPVLRLQYMPNSDIELSFESLIRAVNVPVVPLGSRQRLFYHLYKMDYAQMWPKWGTFMSKGRNGNTVIPLPKFRYVVSLNDLNFLNNTFHIERGVTVTSDMSFTERYVFISRHLTALKLGPESLFNFLGFSCPVDLINHIDKFLTDADYVFSGFIIDVPAFPFFAYLSIYRSYYLNPNLLDSDSLSLWFPDSEDDWKLVYPDLPDEEIFFINQVSAENYKAHFDSSFDPTKISRFGKLLSSNFRFRNFADDYFTSSLFYPMRGDIPELPIDGVIQSLNIPSPDFQISNLTSEGSSLSAGGSIDYFTLTDGTFQVAVPDGSGRVLFSGTSVNVPSWSAGSPASGSISGQVSIAPQILSNVAIQFASGYTWEMIRNLSISTVIQEKMARTDGSYIEFVRTFFDQFPSKFADNRPEYVEGDLLPIIYTEVLQNSEDGNTPLGTIGGKGISNGNGYLGKVHCDDFGLLLGIVSILPDTYYSQGWSRQDMYAVQEDFPLPERAELGMQGVYNGEIYYQGNDEDLGLFGYISRFDEWRYAPNEISGKLSDPSSLSFFPYTQSRYFYSLPVLSDSFVSTEKNIRKDYLSVANEVPFYAQFAHRIKVIQPLPYKAVPVGLK